MTDDQVAWTARQFAVLANGAAWAIPSSGLIFTRRGESTLVLLSRMPHGANMAISEAQLREQQQSDYEEIKTRAEAAGITVKDETT